MKIDIISIVIEKSSQSHIRFALKKATGEYVDYATFFCISRPEWEFIKQCMLGTAQFYPYMGDISYAIKFYPDGMRCRYSDQRPDEFFTWPTKECIPYVEQLWDVNVDEHRAWDKEQVCKFVDLTSLISDWQERYAPVIEFSIDPDVKERLLKDEQSPLLSEPVQYPLLDAMKNWAAGYSDGNKVIVSISREWTHDDNQPSSYGWWIGTPSGQRIANGGWVAHRDYAKDGVEPDTFHYSMHT